MDEESKYAYFVSSLGLIRAEISDIKHIPKFKIGLVLRDESFQIPTGAALFSLNNIVYLVGGVLDGDGDGDRDDPNDSFLLKFDHNKFQKLPPNSIPSFEFLKKSHFKYAPMLAPRVIPTPSRDMTYFINNNRLRVGGGEAFGFQSYNTNKYWFRRHPNPPIRQFPSRQPYGHFLLGSCLYLFVENSDFTSVIYTFDTKSLETSKWKENTWLASQFQIKEFPAPSDHRGDVVLSDELFDDNTRIMVALHRRKLIAYLVRFVAGWESFEPISYRFLTESHKADPAGSSKDGWTHLTDFGGGRFCVVYASEWTDLMMYVVSIDFKAEYKIQTSAEYKIQPSEVSIGMASSTILSYEKFTFQEQLENLPSEPYPSIAPEFCFLSAPPASPTTRKGQENMKR